MLSLYNELLHQHNIAICYISIEYSLAMIYLQQYNIEYIASKTHKLVVNRIQLMSMILLIPVLHSSGGYHGKTQMLIHLIVIYNKNSNQYVTRSDKVGLIAKKYICSVYGLYQLICGCYLIIV